MRPPRYRYHGATTKIIRKGFRIQSGRHQNKFQIFPPGQEVLQDDQQEIGIQIAFVDLLVVVRR